MNNKNIITKTKIMGLLVVLFMGVLVGCPTEAPKEKDKSGDDGGGDPPPEISISFSHIGSHEIVATTSVNIDIDGEVTFAITDKKDEPTIPDPEIITDGFITRTFTNGQTRKVYMAQLGTPNLPDGVSLGTINDIDDLHGAFMDADMDYFLHTFYTKQGDDDVTHTSTAFTTTAHRNSGAFFAMVQNIEWKQGKENLILIIDTGAPIVTTINAVLSNEVSAGHCNPPTKLFPAQCGNEDGYKATMFYDQSLFIVKGAATNTNTIGTWGISYHTYTGGVVITKITK